MGKSCGLPTVQDIRSVFLCFFLVYRVLASGRAGHGASWGCQSYMKYQTVIWRSVSQ